jgi:hypothetical protein
MSRSKNKSSNNQPSNLKGNAGAEPPPTKPIKQLAIKPKGSGGANPPKPVRGK